jgi:hypothetical protein
VFDATALVAIVNVAEDAPTGTVTLEGTEAPLVADKVTMVPPLPDGLARVTVPVEEAPPTSSLGFTERPANVAGLTVNVADLDPP